MKKEQNNQQFPTDQMYIAWGTRTPPMIPISFQKTEQEKIDAKNAQLKWRSEMRKNYKNWTKKNNKQIN